MFSNNLIEIIKLQDNIVYEIVPSKIKKDWMSDKNGHAYKCKPLNIASTYGWDVLCPYDFDVTWNGGLDKSDMTFQYLDESICHECSPMASHFGNGIITFKMDFIIKTSENISTYIRSSPNTINFGLRPLDAIVETDWLPFTFTYNIKFESPGTASFKKGESLCTFFPIERGFVEGFETKVSHIKDYPELQKEFEEYLLSRNSHNSSSDSRENYKAQDFYKNGISASGKKYDIKNHSKIINLKSFMGLK